MKNPLPGQIDKISTMADRGIRVQFTSNELTPKQSTELFELYGKFGYFFFSEQEVQPLTDDLPPIQVEKGEKTPSQRLRAVIFVVWENETSKKVNFDTYYKQEVEKIIEHYKSKLD